MLSSSRLVNRAWPFGSSLQSRFWISPQGTIQTPMRMGATFFFHIGSIWFEIAATTLFLERVGLAGLIWIFSAIALLHLGRQLLSQVFSLRLSSFWLTAIALLPALLGLLLLDRWPLHNAIYPFGLAGSIWQLGLIQLSALLLHQRRSHIQVSVMGGFSTIAAAATCLGGWPLLASMGMDLDTLLPLSGLLLVLSLGLDMATAAFASSTPPAALTPLPKRQDSIANVRLRQFSWVFLSVYALLQVLACTVDIQLFSQVLGNGSPEVIGLSASLSADLSGANASGAHLSRAHLSGVAIALGWLYIITGLGGPILQGLMNRGVFARHGAFMALGILPLALLGWGILGLGLGLPVDNPFALLLAPSLCRIWQVTFQRDAQHKLLSLLPASTQQQLRQQLALGGVLAWGLAATLLFCLVPDFAAESLGLIIVMASILLLGALIILRPRYVRLLIATVAEGNLRAPSHEAERPGSYHPDPLLTRAIIQALKASLRSPVQLIPAQQSIQLLAQVNLSRACAVLMPLLPSLPEALQLVSLEVLQQQPNPAHEVSLRHLMTPASKPEVYAAALRYLLQIAPPTSAESLLRYLKSDVKSQVRAVAAAYMLSHGNASTQRSAGLAFVHLLNQDSELDRLVGAEALRDAGDLARLRQYIAPLLEDFSAPVRGAVLQAIAQTRSQSLYDLLIKALHSPLTQADAQQALQGMSSDAVQLLQQHCKQSGLSAAAKQKTWETLAQLTFERPEPKQAALNALALELTHSSGSARQQLLTLLLQQPNHVGIQAVHKLLGKKTGLMALLREELWLLGHLYSALVDLKPQHPESNPESRIFREALIEQQRNVGERVLLLLQFLYPRRSMTLAVKRLHNRHTIPRGLALLERILDPEIKPRILAVFAAQSADQKLAQLKQWVAYEPLPGQQRLQSLLDLKPGLENWPRACAYHLASKHQWRISDEQLLDGLNHRNPAVKDAANSYLSQVSSSMIQKVNDPKSQANPPVHQRVKVWQRSNPGQDHIPWL